MKNVPDLENLKFGAGFVAESLPDKFKVKWPHWMPKTSKERFAQYPKYTVALLLGWIHEPMRGPLNEQWRHQVTNQRASNESLPDYCNSLDAAIQLCDFLAEKGWTCRIDNGLDKTWECTFQHGCWQYYAAADKLSRAISEAFVKVMEEK